MNRMGFVAAVIVLAASSTAAQEKPPTALPEIDPATAALYQRFLAEYKNPNSSAPALVTDLAAAKDADLCFLNAVDTCPGDWRWCVAREQLGKLNTQRTFEVVAARLKSENRWVREKATGLIGAFRRGETVTLLIEVLGHEPEAQNRRRAAEALHPFADARAEGSLLKAAREDDLSVAVVAASALGAIRSPDGFKQTVNLLRKVSRDDQYDRAIQAVGEYRSKAAIEVLLQEYQRLLPREDEWADRLRHDVDVILSRLGSVTFESLGPKPDTLEQWQDWWAQAQPLLTDDLQLKTPPKKPRAYREEEFGNTPGDLTLSASVDAEEYRTGDPIRLDLKLTNASRTPYATVVPRLPSGWYPTMAYGIRLSWDKKVILDLAPSDYYIGSYSGPPKFETLPPGETFRSSVCLQHFLRPQVDLPLPEGEYELTVSFDSAKFPGIKPGGVQLVHEWEANPVRFTVKGPARKDAAEILRVVGEKTGLKWIETDLTSPQHERRTRAWLAVFNYGDSRLAEMVAKIETKHADKSYHYLSAKELMPFESQAIPK
jgi:hypothetical protein